MSKRQFVCELHKTCGLNCDTKRPHSWTHLCERACQDVGAVCIPVLQPDAKLPGHLMQIGRLEDTMVDAAIPEFFKRATGREYRGQDGGDLCVNDIRALLMLFWNQRVVEQPAPEPPASPVDLDAIRRAVDGHAIGLVGTAAVLALRDEIERGREERDYLREEIAELKEMYA